MNIREIIFLIMFNPVWSFINTIRDPVFQLMCLLVFIIFLLLPIFHIKKLLSYYFFVIGFALFRLVRFFYGGGGSAEYTITPWEVSPRTYLALTIINVLLASLSLFLYLKKYKQKARWLSIFSIILSVYVYVFYSFVTWFPNP